MHIDELKTITPPNRIFIAPIRLRGRICRANLGVEHTLLVTFARDNPGSTSNLPLGRKAGRLYIASYVPATQ